MRNLIKNFGAFSVGPLVGAVIGFITVPLITYFISPDEYGRASMFTLAQSTVSTVIYLGMDQAFVREYNAYKKDIGRLLSNAIIIPLFIACITSILIVVFSGPISRILFGTDNEFIAVLGLAILLPFMVIENFSLLTIRMKEKGRQYSFFTILLKTTILALTVLLFLLYEKSFRSVVYAAALAEILNGLLLIVIVLRKQNLSVEYIEKKTIQRMLRFGLPLVPAFAIGWILTSMDKVMLRTLCTYEELGLYSAAFKIVSILSIVQTCFSLYWTPVAYRWYEQQKDERNYELVGHIVALGMTVMCLGILLFKNLVGIILGPGFRSAIAIFPFLLLHPILYTISEATAVGIGFKRKTGYNIIISAISGGTNILLNWILIPVLGGVGAAIATGLSYVAFFWGRTIVSSFIWYKMHMKLYALLIAIIIVNCYVHTFFTGPMPYLVTAVSLLIMCGVVWIYIKKHDIIRRVKENDF